jgi:hypothetical protein
MDRMPVTGYQVARIRTLPILHRASCILHPYLNKAVGPYDRWAIEP